MAASMTRKKGDLASLELAENEDVGGGAEGRFHAFLVNVGESGHGVEPTAADDANFCACQDVLLQKYAQGLKPRIIFLR
jgi:hypothetical protein